MKDAGAWTLSRAYYKKGHSLKPASGAHRLQIDFVGDTPGYIDRDSGDEICTSSGGYNKRIQSKQKKNRFIARCNN